jgi:hypothetical protein
MPHQTFGLDLHATMLVLCTVCCVLCALPRDDPVWNWNIRILMTPKLNHALWLFSFISYRLVTSTHFFGPEKNDWVTVSQHHGSTRSFGQSHSRWTSSLHPIEIGLQWGIFSASDLSKENKFLSPGFWMQHILVLPKEAIAADFVVIAHLEPHRDESPFESDQQTPELHQCQLGPHILYHTPASLLSRGSPRRQSHPSSLMSCQWHIRENCLRMGMISQTPFTTIAPLHSLSSTSTAGFPDAVTANNPAPMNGEVAAETGPRCLLHCKSSLPT